MARVLVGVIIAACAASGCGDDGGASPPDASAGLIWRVFVIDEEPDAAGHAMIRVDGVADPVREETYADEEAARGETRVIETVVDGRVVDRVVLGFPDARCDDAGETLRRADSYCAFASGELRESSIECTTTLEGSVGDALCTPRCGIGSCRDGLRCGLDRDDADATRGWLDCVAPGAVAVGGVCTIGADGVDDCAEGGYCLGGVCAAACANDADPSCGAGRTCAVLPSPMSPFIYACQPA